MVVGVGEAETGQDDEEAEVVYVQENVQRPIVQAVTSVDVHSVTLVEAAVVAEGGLPWLEVAGHEGTEVGVDAGDVVRVHERVHVGEAVAVVVAGPVESVASPTWVSVQWAIVVTLSDCRFAFWRALWPVSAVRPERRCPAMDPSGTKA